MKATRLIVCLGVAGILALPSGAGQTQNSSLELKSKVAYFDVLSQTSIAVREQNGLFYVDVAGFDPGVPKSQEKVHLIFPRIPDGAEIPIGGVVSGKYDPLKANRVRGGAQFWRAITNKTSSTWNSSKSIYDPDWNPYFYSRPQARKNVTYGGSGWIHRSTAPDGTSAYMFYGEFMDDKQQIDGQPFIVFYVDESQQQVSTEKDAGKG